MKRLATLFTQSYEEMRKPRTITACAMFAAAAVVLGYFTISVGNYVKIGFSGIPNVLVGCLFGPAAGGFFGGFMDLFKYIVKPLSLIHILLEQTGGDMLPACLAGTFPTLQVGIFLHHIGVKIVLPF